MSESESNDPTINLDDVEGHGLKEVAVGLSTAGILVASAAGVAHAAGGGGGTGATVHLGDKTISAEVSTPTVTTPTITLPDVAVPHVAAPHVAAPQVKVPHVATPQVHVDVKPALDSAITTVKATQHALHNDVVSVKATASNVEHTAHTTVSGTKAAAATTVARTQTLVQTTLRAEVTHIGQAYTAVVHVVSGDKGTTVNAHDASGSVILTSAGEAICNANVVNGLATLHWSGEHGSMTLTFGGDGNHSGASITI